ncbi:MAG: DNA recombination protein RmuC [Bacteroidia bacterium]|nr:DNA recombination protein RmuC [Bacteroidia bacterium]
MEIVLLVLGLVAGAVIGWLFTRQKALGERGVPVEEINSRYISIDLFNQEKQENSEKEKTIIALNSRIAELSANLKNMEERFAESKKEIDEIHKKFSLEFKNLSNEVLEEKSKKFLELNEKNMGNILNPLKEKIKEFEGKIDEVYKDETRERISLKKELENIVKLNQQVSDDTHKLTNALKGDKKLLGDWGEVQLEMILEKAGLQRDIHYRKQETIKDDEGKNLRPDYIINLPEEKQLIVDSKVSLVAYERYFNTDDENVKSSALRQHLNDLLNHVRDLGDKNYQKLYGINPPDYVLMFVPIEPALAVAQREDSSLFDKALKKNIVMVSTSTLLATLRTINFIWNQDKQRKNVYEIAKQSGALYEKFTGFIDDLIQVGRKMDDAKSEYSNAMNKLYESKKRGDTIIGRIEKLKELGADTSKSLPQNILDRLEE